MGHIIRNGGFLLIAAVALLSMGGSALAFKLSPTGTALERQRARVNSGILGQWWFKINDFGAVSKFTEPVHEEITHRIFGCDADPEVCGQVEVEYAPMAILAGVRWNDDPPFRLSKTSIKACKIEETIRFITQPMCWAKLFRHAEATSKSEYYDFNHSASNMMYRSHFGDLQFLHAMASREGEKPEETRRRILMWAEFAWRVSFAEYKNADLLRDVRVDGFNSFFGKSGQNVQDLFALGNPELRKRLNEIAFGSLLHMVEDSFAQGHVARREPVLDDMCPGSDHPRPGLIQSFRSYQNQDHKWHAKYDARPALASHLVERPNVVAVGRILYAYYEQKASWEAVRPYLECVFTLDNHSGVAHGEGPAIEARPQGGLAQSTQ